MKRKTAAAPAPPPPEFVLALEDADAFFGWVAGPDARIRIEPTTAIGPTAKPWDAVVVRSDGAPVTAIGWRIEGTGDTPDAALAALQGTAGAVARRLLANVRRLLGPGWA